MYSFKKKKKKKKKKKPFTWTSCALEWQLIHHILDAKYIMGYGFIHESICHLLVFAYKMNKYHYLLFPLQY